MAIELLIFGQLNEVISKNKLDLSMIQNTDDLLKELQVKFPELSTMNYAIAVNKNIIHQSTTLTQNDTIALLPAFSGG